MAAIAFLGLGNMGAGMAANLAKAGHRVVGYDPNPAAGAEGVAAAPAIPDAVAGAEVVVSMLPAGAHVRAAYGEVRAAASAGALFLDCSTIDVATARAVAAEAEAAGFAMADAPVSGGIAAAAAGTLTFMVGATPEVFARAEPILAAMGKAVIHAGAPGAGQAAKICNNMLLAVSMIGTCEAFALAERLGLAPDRFFDIASRSSGQCWSLTSYSPWPGVGPEAPSDRDYAAGFAVALMLKDLKLAQAAAAEAGAATPLGAAAEALYALLDRQGLGGKDFSVMQRFLRGGV